MTPEYRAVCFDMDGTLLDSMKYWRLGNIEFLIRHDLPLDRELLKDAMFESNRVMVPRYVERYGLTGDLQSYYGEYEQRMRVHYERDVRPKPGALEYLMELERRGVRACVATATERHIAREALARHGLTDHLEFVTDSREIGCGKEDPEYFRRLAARLGLEASEIVMFEDSLYAMRSAKAAGFRVFGIADGAAWRNGQAIREICDVYVQSFWDMMPGGAADRG